MGGCGDTGAPGAAGQALRPCSHRGKRRRLELPTTNHHPRPGPRPHRTERGRAGRNAETRSPPERAVSPLRGASREAASRLLSTRWSGYFTSEQNSMILNSSNGLTRVIYSHQRLIPHGEGAESQPREYSETPTCKSDFLCGLQNAKSRGETGNDRDSGAKGEELLSGSCWLCAGGKPGTPQIRGPVRGCLLLPSVATEKEKEEERKERNEADDGRVARCARAPEE